MARRLFIAIPLSPTQQNRVLSLLTPQREKLGSDGVRWIQTENYHMTLEFLGNIEGTLEKQLYKGLESIAQNMSFFELKFEQLITFPPSKPSVLALYASNNEYSLKLVAKIHELLDEIGINYKRKAFLPHISVARLKKFLAHTVQDVSFNLRCDSMTLFESISSSGGVEYISLADFKFTNG